MMTEREKLKIFGRNIAKYRKAAGYSQNTLAELIDVSREHLAKVETAKRGISLDLLFKISEVLNVPEKEFFEFKLTD